ncbi:hypothetical protein LTR62_004116 [Meristemomyces frigidus]|uniref:Uncharacterized protein n=1 Tax=Meristemomyces frigidus TaxID=1508187 RepID=A0AAN7TXD1_9PEZI|nr:hypothetical protein LTR62_004116 [Meristemomyces frigidus]
MQNSMFYPAVEPFSNYQTDYKWRYPYSVFPPQDVREGPRRNAPAEPPFKEYDPFNRCWRQGNRRLPGFKPKYYFTRPCDGKRAGALGRIKDALTGEGPDVFITINGDKRTLMRDRPQRHAWSGWGLTPEEIRDRVRYDPDWRGCDAMPVIGMSWTHNRNHEPLYNYQNREFITPEKMARQPQNVWTNVDWGQGGKDGWKMPLSYRDTNRNWTTRVNPWAGLYPGARPRR